MKYSLVILSLLLVLVSCVKPEPRRPVSHHSGTYMAESVKLNKQINAMQDVAIKYYIAQDSMNNYLSSSNGFRYSYIYQITEDASKPKIDDEVFFEYEISDLTNNVLYSKEELGENRYIIDKEDVESGLQNGLKLMKEDEEVKFIFPSFKAFGFSGDQQRIGINQPLIYKVKLNKIVEKQ